MTEYFDHYKQSIRVRERVRDTGTGTYGLHIGPKLLRDDFQSFTGTGRRVRVQVRENISESRNSTQESIIFRQK